ncbi:50S ribosomal protein L9 [Candidatus Kaiserbacteria bacterium]|nr:MAG: 50S ribosomal protein L9 [Candidatus Kaiserbacteria bacterium]
MKVILLKDVAKVGQKGEVKELSNGYAQNFLIAHGLAEVATDAKIKNAQKAETERASKQEETKAVLEGSLKKLKGEGLVIRATTNEKGHLFEALHADIIAAHIKDVVGVEVEAASVVIDTPIKEIGEHTVHVQVGTTKVPVVLSVQTKE